MNTMGLVISHKSGEKRRALLPDDLSRIKYLDYLKFEIGYGNSIGISDDEYIQMGASMVSREEALDCDIITDVKLGDADYLNQISEQKILFGWAHAVQNVDFTESVLRSNHTVIAWEEIFEEGR